MAAINPRDDDRPVRVPMPEVGDGSRLPETKLGTADDALERALIEEVLADNGHTLQSITTLPPARRDALRRSAAEHASLRLAEIESRAHFVKDLER